MEEVTSLEGGLRWVNSIITNLFLKRTSKNYGENCKNFK
tara:strand:- start:783 stop:899 length:117 start_codon:yes stop_codon:yes gene_type:complete